jgi:hypothetical protein
MTQQFCLVRVKVVSSINNTQQANIKRRGEFDTRLFCYFSALRKIVSQRPVRQWMYVTERLGYSRCTYVKCSAKNFRRCHWFIQISQLGKNELKTSTVLAP